MTRFALGDVEHLVLIAVLRLGDESYGVPILEEIADRTGRTLTRAAVYIALRRLEAKELLTSEMRGATTERGGRAKRYFNLTQAGYRQLRASRSALVNMWSDVEHLIARRAGP